MDKFSLRYDGEQWRDAGDNEPPSPQTMEFQYGFGNTFSTVAAWTTPGAGFNFTSPVFTMTTGPIDGNGAGRLANLGGTVDQLSWQTGDTLWLRWLERNDLGLDHAMAIDNVSFSATVNTVSAVPEAKSGVVCIVMLCTVAGLLYYKALWSPFAGRKGASPPG